MRLSRIGDSDFLAKSRTPRLSFTRMTSREPYGAIDSLDLEVADQCESRGALPSLALDPATGMTIVEATL